MIYLYAVNIEDNISDDLVEVFSRMISEERKRKTSKFVYLVDRVRSIVAEVTIRYALWRQYGVNTQEIRFSYNEYGKPELDGLKDIFFNISHSGMWVLCAIGDVPLGVDIEKITSTDMKIAQRFFNKKEYIYLQKQPLEIQYREFFKIWTLKECYIKEEGKGLNIPLDSFSFSFNDNGIVVCDQCGVRTDLRFQVGQLEQEYCYAVCVAGDEVLDDNIQVVTMQELIDFGKFFGGGKMKN